MTNQPLHPAPARTREDPPVAAPNIAAPNIAAPNIAAPNIAAPNIAAPNISSGSVDAPLSDHCEDELAPNAVRPAGRWRTAGPEAAGDAGRVELQPEGAAAFDSAEDLAGPPPTQAHPHPIDAGLLEVLNQCFTDHAGPESRLGATDLQASLEIRDPFLAQRMLSLFDQNGDGVVTRAEFLDRVRRLVFGSVNDKIRFAFRIHDLDGDNVITRPELLRMITLSMAEERTLSSPHAAEVMTDMLLRAADLDRDGRISYEEFAAVVARHPAVLDLITRSEASWLTPNEDLLEHFQQVREKGQLLGRFLQNHWAQVAILTAWTVANAALFAAAAWRYHELGANGWVMVARGAGACLNLNGALVLLPVMRRLLTRVRKTSALRWLPVDDALAFHRLVGHAMFGFALLHTGAHLLNYWRSGIGIGAGLFGTGAGLTGLFLLLVFAWMWWCARPSIRGSGRFELFYFSHLLYVAWFALCLAHGPVFYLWAGVPLLAFGLEQLTRQWARTRRTEILSAIPLRSGVTRLELARPVGFQHRAGDYLFIRIPALAHHEWHPFTISSAPERERLTLHVRTLGNFTSALRERVERRHATDEVAPLEAFIDGPYGTASAHVFESRNAVLIGAGIGVTPFASVLESVVLRARDGATNLKKVHFYWINRDAYSFEWFAALLMSLEAMDHAHLVDVHVCMTGGRGHITAVALSLAREIAHQLGHPDQITGLRAQTKVGRPDWATELRRIAELHSPEPVDVYFCGPPGLARKLKRLCQELGLGFRQEHF